MMATGLKHELYLGGWIDVTGDARGATTINHGPQGDRSLDSTSSCVFTLDNRSGDYSPRNQSGTYYGVIGRNTPHRCSVTAAESYLLVPGGSAGANDTSSTPDSAALSITGDIEVWVDVTLKSWRTSTVIIGKWTSAAGNRSWAVNPNDDGTVTWYWSDDGSTTYTETSTAVVPIETGRLTIKITMDVNDGSGNRVTTFYTADSVGGSTTQLGDAVTTSGTASIYDGNAVVAVGDGTTGGRFVGQVHEAAIYDGIGGSLVADPDFTVQTAGAATFNDGQGNTWTQNGSAEISDREYLWHGEVQAWPRSRDASGTDVTVAVTSSGLDTRRLRARTLAGSAYRRGVTSVVAPMESVVAYWPCEDATDAASIASGLDGHPSMKIVGSPTLANDSIFICSEPILTLTSGSALVSGIPSYSGTGDIQVRMLVHVPSGGVTTQRLLKLVTDGTAAIWEINLNSSGNLQLIARDSTGTVILTDGYYAFNLNGSHFRLSLSLSQNGSDVDYVFATLGVGYSVGSAPTGTLVGYTVSSASVLTVGPDLALTDLAVGQITVQSVVSSTFSDDSLLAAYTGTVSDDEQAGIRLLRIAGEESMTLRLHGGRYQTVHMGPQLIKPIGDLMRECAAADGGILVAERDELALAYRTRSSMTGQASARLTLDYSAADLSGWAPIDDDELTVNQLELSRDGGSKVRDSIDSGPLSTADPPDGAGVSPDTATLSLEYDRYLADQLSWRLHLGTVDAPRTTDLPIELARDSFSATADRRAALAVRIGDRIDVINPPADDGADDLEFLVVGMQHAVDHFTHRISYRCWPYEAFRVGIWHRYGVASGVGTADRWSGEGTVIAEDLDTTETGVDITAADMCEWAHDDGDYDVRVNGEVMTVTGISGSHPSYTLTVTRSVNGVIATHSNGDAIDLDAPTYWGL